MHIQRFIIVKSLGRLQRGFQRNTFYRNVVVVDRCGVRCRKYYTEAVLAGRDEDGRLHVAVSVVDEALDC